jgi:UPF0755 protein
VYPLLALALLLAAAAWFAYWALSPIGLSGKASTEIYVPPGAGLRSVHSQLVQAGARLPELPFFLLARLGGDDRAIRVGAYEILSGMSPRSLLAHLRRGRVLQSTVTIPEGWTFAQIRNRFQAHPDFRGEVGGLSDADILRLIGAEESSLEGLLFPDSYYFDKKSSDIDVLGRAHRAMRKHLEEAWQGRSPAAQVKTPYEALILASIIEKETGIEADRRLVSAVFNNRLRIGMRLQSDPTVIFGLGEAFDGNLRKRDLQQPTPYNTYTIAGLPPTPISTVSLASLQAALAPAESRALYFVARGDGSSEFSETLAAHNRAVYKYQIQGSRR